MAAEIVNLNKVRKAKARADKEQRAEENRIRFGMTKAERASIDSETAHGDAVLDGAKRETANDAAHPRDSGNGDDNDLDPGTVS